MRAVHVGVGHDDDLVGSAAWKYRTRPARSPCPAPSRGLPISWRGAQHLRSNRARSTVQDLAPERQHRLASAGSRPVCADPPALFALHEEQLRLRRVLFRTVSSAFRRGRFTAPSPFLRRVSSRALRAASRACAALHDLAHDHSAPAPDSPRTIPPASLPIRFSTAGRTSEDTSLSFVWLENFGSGTFHRQHAGQPLAHVVAGEIHLLALGNAAVRLAYRVTVRRQCCTKASHVSAAVPLGAVVGKRQHHLVVAVVPPLPASTMMPSRSPMTWIGLGQHRRLGPVEILHELL